MSKFYKTIIFSNFISIKMSYQRLPYYFYCKFESEKDFNSWWKNKFKGWKSAYKRDRINTSDVKKYYRQNLKFYLDNEKIWKQKIMHQKRV